MSAHAPALLTGREEATPKSLTAWFDRKNKYRDLKKTLDKVGVKWQPVTLVKLSGRGELIEELSCLHVDAFDACQTKKMLQNLLPAYQVTKLNNDTIEIR